MADLKVGVTLPGELLAVELLKTVQMLIAGQPPEVQHKLWQWYVDDMTAWRKFWGFTQ